MSILIFANGMLDDLEWIRPYFAQKTAVIAANGGSKHLFALDEPPDLLIGDLDSLTPEIQQWLNKRNCTFITHPPEKDETDLELALLYAVAHYQADILLFGMMGGRLDQTLANILLLTHPALRRRSVTLVTALEKAWVITEEGMINGRIGDTISLIPLKGDIFFQSTSGLQYPLQQETLAFGPARGVSNVLTQPQAQIKINPGLLLCVHTHQKL
jgi:thiamine pyrophosphokinase